jgi:hypothetical protein
LLDADQHALAIDIAGAQHRHFGRTQARAISNAKRGLVLEAWAGGRFEKPGHVFRA